MDELNALRKSICDLAAKLRQEANEAERDIDCTLYGHIHAARTRECADRVEALAYPNALPTRELKTGRKPAFR